MKPNEQRQAAQKFVDDWIATTYEKGEAQTFWIELLRKVYGIENPKQFIKFEEHVKSGFIFPAREDPHSKVAG